MTNPEQERAPSTHQCDFRPMPDTYRPGTLRQKRDRVVAFASSTIDSVQNLQDTGASLHLYTGLHLPIQNKPLATTETLETREKKHTGLRILEKGISVFFRNSDGEVCEKTDATSRTLELVQSTPEKETSFVQIIEAIPAPPTSTSGVIDYYVDQGSKLVSSVLFLEKPADGPEESTETTVFGNGTVSMRLEKNGRVYSPTEREIEDDHLLDMIEASIDLSVQDLLRSQKQLS